MRLKVSLPDDSVLAEAVQMLRAGKLVAFPTETVYGLGADAEHDAAVRSIFVTKGRPAQNPLIVHVADLAMAERYGIFSAQARRLAEANWPGPLTLVVPVRDNSLLSRAVFPGGATVALRVPKGATAEALLQGLGRGIAAPSANRSGRVSPTTAQHVLDEFRDAPGNLAMILDGGATEVGLESTVVDCCGEGLRILRPGYFGGWNVGMLECWNGGMLENEGVKGLLSPGMLESHYAPRAQVRLNATSVCEGEGLLAFGSFVPSGAKLMLNLSPAGDVIEAAVHFYDYLRRLDMECSRIAVMPVPEEGMGIALNDRLRRAAFR